MVPVRSPLVHFAVADTCTIPAEPVFLTVVVITICFGPIPKKPVLANRWRLLVTCGLGLDVSWLTCCVAIIKLQKLRYRRSTEQCQNDNSNHHESCDDWGNLRPPQIDSTGDPICDSGINTNKRRPHLNCLPGCGQGFFGGVDLVIHELHALQRLQVNNRVYIKFSWVKIRASTGRAHALCSSGCTRILGSVSSSRPWTRWY